LYQHSSAQLIFVCCTCNDDIMAFEFRQQATKVKQLSDIIGQEISMGKYKSDEALPSINRLSLEYHVSRDTVFKAFADLKDKDIIDSKAGKGYYVVNRQKNILLLLDEYSAFKETLYNSFVSGLSSRYNVDLWFHMYKERQFNRIIRESIGKYNDYVVMNFDNERFSSYLNQIDASRLLLLDFGKFDKKRYSYICQDFDEAFCQALKSLDERLHHYHKLVLLHSHNMNHPKSTCVSFQHFCEEEDFQYEVKDSAHDFHLHKGEVYIAILQSDVVNIIKESREKNLVCGKDFGLIAYNDIPAYEIIDKGITSLSVDWKKMGRMAADFILTGKPVQLYLPTEVHLRGSL
jgi:DNA-binding transcriptional regulator YhcF (GntR family)